MNLAQKSRWQSGQLKRLTLTLTMVERALQEGRAARRALRNPNISDKAALLQLRGARRQILNVLGKVRAAQLKDIRSSRH